MMNILFLTKQKIAIAGAGEKIKTNEKEELDAIMKKNGYKKGYRGMRIMVDDIILDEEYPPQARE